MRLREDTRGLKNLQLELFGTAFSHPADENLRRGDARKIDERRNGVEVAGYLRQDRAIDSSSDLYVTNDAATRRLEERQMELHARSE